MAKKEGIIKKALSGNLKTKSGPSKAQADQKKAKAIVAKQRSDHQASEKKRLAKIAGRKKKVGTSGSKAQIDQKKAKLISKDQQSDHRISEINRKKKIQDAKPKNKGIDPKGTGNFLRQFSPGYPKKKKKITTPNTTSIPTVTNKKVNKVKTTPKRTGGVGTTGPTSGAGAGAGSSLPKAPKLTVPELKGGKATPKYKQTRKQKRQAAKSASLTARADSSEKTGLYTRKKVDRLRNRAKRKDERSKGTRKSAVGTVIKAVGKGAQAVGHAYAYGNTDRLKGNKVSSSRKGVARAAADKVKEGERKKAGFNKYTKPSASKFKPIKSKPIVSKKTPSLGRTGSKKKKNKFTSKK